jgi:hypothetical protein
MYEINCGMRKLVAQNFLVPRTELKEARPEFDHAWAPKESSHGPRQSRIHGQLNLQRFFGNIPDRGQPGD